MVQDLGFKNGPLSPQDVGKSPQKAEHPLPPLCPTKKKNQKTPLWKTNPLTLSLTRWPFLKGPSHLTCSCQSASLVEISSPGQFGASSPASVRLRALSVHPPNSRMHRVLSDLEQTRCTVREAQPERLKALTSRKRQTINLSPT